MKATELLNKIIDGKKPTYFSDPAHASYYTVTQKQFGFVWALLCAEFPKADPSIPASVTDENGKVFTLNWKRYKWNVPHFIKNREQYGKTFFIHVQTPTNL